MSLDFVIQSRIVYKFNTDCNIEFGREQLDGKTTACNKIEKS